jgi:hypothetical protein
VPVGIRDRVSRATSRRPRVVHGLDAPGVRRLQLLDETDDPVQLRLHRGSFRVSDLDPGEVSVLDIVRLRTLWA